MKDIYLETLRNSYFLEKSRDEFITKDSYLSDHIFDFTTYDYDIDDQLVPMAIGVCKAITQRKTFDFIQDKDRYLWFILMCNMPFFRSKISWGSSIRGAFWDTSETISIESCGLYDSNQNQTTKLEFKGNEWIAFIEAVIEFQSEELE